VARSTESVPTDIAISTGQRSSSRAPAWAAPQTVLSAGAIMKPNNGGEKNRLGMRIGHGLIGLEEGKTDSSEDRHADEVGRQQATSPSTERLPAAECHQNRGPEDQGAEQVDELETHHQRHRHLPRRDQPSGKGTPRSFRPAVRSFTDAVPASE
jgi:hypothetical protein